MRIAIALFEDAEELDWAGPWEVLAMWAQLWPADGVEVFTVADKLEPIRCAKGLRVLADRTWDEAGAIDVLVVPGGDGTRPLLGDEIWRGRLRTLADGGTLVTSVCTGALVLADAGLLDGRPATTYWQRLDFLASLGTGIWTRHTWPPDLNPSIRRWFADAGFSELDFVSAGERSYAVGMNELRIPPQPLL